MKSNRDSMLVELRALFEKYGVEEEDLSSWMHGMGASTSESSKQPGVVRIIPGVGISESTPNFHIGLDSLTAIAGLGRTVTPLVVASIPTYAFVSAVDLIYIECGTSVSLIATQRRSSWWDFDGPLGTATGAEAIQEAEEAAKAAALSDLNRQINKIRCPKGCRPRTVGAITGPTVTESYAVSVADWFLVSWEQGFATAEARCTVSCPESG